MKKKNSRILITIECLNCRKNKLKNIGGVSRYTTEKCRTKNPQKLKLKKFCKFCITHTTHHEIK